MFHVKHQDTRMYDNSIEIYKYSFLQIVSHETLQSEIIAGIMTAQ